MKDKKLIEEKDLDKLLNDLFLEESSVKAEENSARFVMEQNYDVKINAKKEKELLRKLSGKPNGGSHWNYLIIILIVAVGGIGVLFFTKHTTSDKNNSDKNDTQEHDVSTNRISTAVSVPPLQFNKIKDNTSQQLHPPFTDSKSNLKYSPDLSVNNIPIYFPQSNSKKNKLANGMFMLTEKDIAMYNKIKNKMLEKLLNIDKGLYTKVEEGLIEYRKEELAIDPFIIRNQAITNLEYKVFLADLIKNGKTEYYKKAAVHTELWDNYNDTILVSTYFQDDKYNDFPVVNISREAVLLFCGWLETEINLYAQKTNPKAKHLTIRLPFDSEWIFATRRGYAQIPDCGGYNTIYDIREGIIDLWYLKRIELIKKRRMSKRTELDELFSENRYGMTEDKTLQLFQKGFDNIGKPITDSLYPNRMDIYSKAAHVSEIIQEHGTGYTVVLGSCWKDKSEYSKMLTEFNTASASPFVGFRIVMINDNKASYKNPFW
jgi:hypothetical protein